MLGLRGRTHVVVLGAGQGIGRESVRALVAAGEDGGISARPTYA